MKVTACLIVYKRQHNIPKIVESLLRWDFIDEILIRDNSKAENVINYGRYLLAKQAKNDIIFTQDDDCIINNLGEIYEKFLEDPTRVCHSGIEDYQKDIPNNIHGESQMAMFGWGAFFDRRWIPVLDMYLKKFGEDYCFYRETDRIFTTLLKQHHNFVLGQIDHMGRTDIFCLSNQPDHIKYKQLAIERSLECLKSP